MTDKFSIISFRQLFQLVLDQISSHHGFFGIPESVFFKPSAENKFKLPRFGQLLETPIGIAAGPHTQMAQNIIAAWLSGARYMELKTIQTLDELEVSKPCIDMQDEGYNCEWSQELKIHESYEQYLNAWIIIHILKHKLGVEGKELGTIFNMSVGYEMQGILNENVQWFFNKMNDCSIEKNQKIEEIRDLFPQIDEIEIPNTISDNITLSTMHGCPPDEIEKIGLYLIEEKRLHTIIKLNPTLLGQKALHNILDKSGFETQVPDAAFEHDLKYPEAVIIIENLQKAALNHNVHFGLKLTNTLESINHKNVFPKNETMMYMSGRALHPIAINLANKLQKDFNGTLDISFSAGANADNIHQIIQCGLGPVTVCSDILKPGGYGLMKQYLDNLSARFSSANAKNIKEYILSKSNIRNTSEAILKNLDNYAKTVTQSIHYKKVSFLEPDIKTNRVLDKFDCIAAPCVDTCPTNQDIPEYMHHVANGDFEKAFEVIMRMNPFPNTTGMVCDHLCQNKCTRVHYDEPLQIREIKRFVAENGDIENKTNPNIKLNGFKVAIIGAGPSGLSSAYFLALAGFEVKVFEKKDKPGGMVSAAIPSFRLTNRAFKNDVERIENLGVKIIYNSNITSQFFNDLKTSYNFIYISTGAQLSRTFKIEGIEAKGVLDPLQFLFDAKNEKKTLLGKNVAIIGGGNTAMDAARTAYRLVGESGKVTVLYRRTIKEMPADHGEIKAVLEEGMDIMELTLPVKVNEHNGSVKSLKCVRMELKNSNSSGRPKPVEISDSEFDLEFDAVIPAIGQDLDIDFINPALLESKPGMYETKIPNVFIGGDALRGASTAINAIGDGRKAAEKIIKKAELSPSLKTAVINYPDKNILMKKRMIKERAITPKEIALSDRKNFKLVSSTLTEEDARNEASRCLLCNEICNSCVTVCPNLALYPFEIEPVNYKLQKIEKVEGQEIITEDSDFNIKQPNQILHIADWCNKCGNCETFCPTSGSPYKEKPHLYLNRQAFEKDDNCYFFDEQKQTLIFKENGQFHQLIENTSEFNYLLNESKIIIDKEGFNIKTISNHNNEIISLKIAAEMSIVFEGVKSLLGLS